jgi:acetyltransferase
LGGEEIIKTESFFNSSFRHDFDWSGQFKLRIGPVLTSNKDQISRSLRDLSAETIRNRFMGGKHEFSPVELEYFTNLDGWNHYAIGLEERERPQRGVAIARMVRSSVDPVEAEIAITIIDDYQGMGLGTFLMRLIVLAASEREIERLSFTFLPQNKSIFKVICKVGPVREESTGQDFIHLCIDMKNVDLEKIKSQLVPLLPSIGMFRSKT